MTPPVQPPSPGDSPSPPSRNGSGKNFRLAAGLLALALLAGLVALYHFDPLKHGFYPRCQLNAITGLQCPGCGGLRALHALLHGRVAEAFRLNPLFMAAVPVALALAGRWLWRRRLDPAARWVIPAGWLWVGVAIVIVFGIVRNLPGLSLAR